MAEETPTLYVLDGTYYVFRAFHAIRHLSNSKGFPTNGLFAFTGMLLNAIRDYEPEYLAVAFDPRGDSFRKETYAEYKANREELPEALEPQLPLFREIVKSLNIPILEVEGFEADDVIGTLVRRGEREGIRVVIFSADKDLTQLLDEDTFMIDTMRGKETRVADVIEKFGVPPEQVADVLGLAGDTSDNIPGVPGIGIKTAGKLISEFGSVESVLENIDDVSGKKRKENLREHADNARLSKELATIRTDVPLELDIDAMKLSAPDFARFDELCAELEFNRYREQIREVFEDASQEDALTRAEDFEYRTVRELEDLEQVVAAIRDTGRLSFDLETTSVDPLEAKIVGFALSWEPGAAVYVPVGHAGLGAGAQLVTDVVLEHVGPLLEDPDIGIIGQHTKYERIILARHGVTLRGVLCDTMLAAYLIDPNLRRYNLDALAMSYLGHRNITFSDVAGSGSKQKRFDEIPVEDATRYAAEDADVTLRLADELLPRLDEQGMRSLHDEIEVPLSAVLADMERTGIRVDGAFLREMEREFSGRIAEIEEEIYDVAGQTFTINSPIQLREILFEELELPVIKRTKTGPSTDQSVLERLRDEHPLPQLILDYRQLAKLVSTYVTALPKLIRPETGRIHTDFNQAVAATGRLSSSNPNLQNIPVRSEEGRRIREAFVTEEGYVLFSADYSQIELRLLAHLSQDEVLLDAFSKGEDVHTRTASEVFDVPVDEVTGEQRAAAKSINFGLIYGMGSGRLARELGISRDEASSYIERYFERIAGVRPFLDELVSRAAEHGYAETMFGRRRPIPQLASSRRRDAALGERLAVNTPVQGSAADIIKVAMIQIHRRLEEELPDARMLLQVHDELVFEAPRDELDGLETLVRREMEGVRELDVPLVVDVGSGSNWAELK